MEREKLSLSALTKSCEKEMECLGYALTTIKNYQKVWNQYARFAASKEQPDVFTEELGANFLKEKYGYPAARQNGKLSMCVMSGIRGIRRLGEWQVYGAFTRVRKSESLCSWHLRDEALVNAYVNAVQTSDNSAATKKMRTDHIRSFYFFLACRGIETVSDVTPALISAYVLSMQGGSQVYMKHKLSTLRYFFRYLHQNGYTGQDLSSAVPHIKAAKNLNVPALWTREEIERLLGGVDRGSPAGKRDYTVLLLAVQLGIRIIDIAALRLENLKWERRTIEFSQRKTGKAIILPMTNELGWALIAYLRTGRPKTESTHVFISCNAPYTPITSGGMGCILNRYMQRCGLRKQEGIVSGMHSLRHALARSLLEKDVPLEVLAEIMGHSSVISSSPYLKVDIEGLRKCALSLEVPV